MEPLLVKCPGGLSRIFVYGDRQFTSFRRSYRTDHPSINGNHVHGLGYMWATLRATLVVSLSSTTPLHLTSVPSSMSYTMKIFTPYPEIRPWTLKHTWNNFTILQLNGFTKMSSLMRYTLSRAFGMTLTPLMPLGSAKIHRFRRLVYEGAPCHTPRSAPTPHPPHEGAHHLSLLS